MANRTSCKDEQNVAGLVQILLIIIIYLLLPVVGFAYNCVLNDAQHTYDIAPCIYFYEDASSQLTAEDIVKKDILRKFYPNAQKVINKGYSASWWWFYFSLTNNSSNQSWVFDLAFPTLDYFELYSLQGKTVTLLTTEGDLFPFNHRKILLNNFVVPVAIKKGETQQFLLCVKTTSEVIIPLKIRSHASLLEHSIKEYSGLWVYFGIMLSMFLYNLFLLIILRDINYLYYILYVLFSALSNISFNGIAYQFFWPHSPWFHNISIVFLGNLAVISYMLFTRSFLLTGTFARGYDVIIKAFIFLIIPIIVIIPFVPLSFSIICLNTMVIIASIFSFIACIIAVINKYKPAYFYLASMLAVVVGVSLISLRNFGILPDVFITRYGFHLGTSIDVILLSIALGYRYNLIKDENKKLVMLQNEVEIAQTIYNSIVQTRIPELPHIAIEIVILQAEEIGGDIAEIKQIDDEKVGIFIADISGHGIPASIGAAMVKMACAHANQFKEHPDKFLHSIENTLLERIGNQFITAAYAVIDTKNMILQTSNAGHYALLLCKANNTILQLRPKGGAIGFYQNAFFEIEEVTIGKGDRIILFTDGIIESRNVKGELFGEERLIDIIQQYNGKNITALKNEITAAAYRWIYPRKKFDDDFTLIIVEIV
ncbi:MAG: SpoIIE family protein phosphatase [Spirochaetes bacterium]|nr:SpoIIE family protein phosphatase [Spirochaetota bacterium]